MKYVWILVVVVILVRIDIIMRFFDKTSAKFEKATTTEVVTEDLGTPTELIGVANDEALKTSPRKLFFTYIDNFQLVPEQEFKDKAIEHLRSHPTLFTEKLDPTLEAAIYRWRGLLSQKNKMAMSFLMELMKSLKGENLEMVKRFFSYAIDEDLEGFLFFYSKSPDSNCMIMSYLGDALPDEEKFNELSERLKALDEYLASDKSIALRPYGQRCQLVLKLTIDKLKAALPPEESEGEALPADQNGTAPLPVAPPVAIPAATPSPAPGTTP